MAHVAPTLQQQVAYNASGVRSSAEQPALSMSSAKRNEVDDRVDAADESSFVRAFTTCWAAFIAVADTGAMLVKLLE